MEISQTTCFRVVLATTATAMWLGRAIVVIFWRKLLLFECEMRVRMKGWKGNKAPVNVSFSGYYGGFFFVAGHFSSAIIYLHGRIWKRQSQKMTKTCQRKYFFHIFFRQYLSNVWEEFTNQNCPFRQSKNHLKVCRFALLCQNQYLNWWGNWWNF